MDLGRGDAAGFGEDDADLAAFLMEDLREDNDALFMNLPHFDAIDGYNFF